MAVSGSITSVSPVRTGAINRLPSVGASGLAAPSGYRQVPLSRKER